MSESMSSKTDADTDCVATADDTLLLADDDSCDEFAT